MYLTLVAFFSIVTPFILIDPQEQKHKNEVVFENNSVNNLSIKTKIIYTKAPTPWVKVINN